MKVFKSLKKSSLSKEVAYQIKEAITNDIYKTGDRLPSERDLVNQFQVSRVTIREALKELEKDGLVYIKRGSEGGAYICELNPEPIINSFGNLIRLGKVNIPHLLHARICTEPQIARAAAMTRTDEDIRKLSNIIEESEKCVDSSLTKARMKNLNFHCEISKILNNPVLAFIAESITFNFTILIIKITKAKINKDEVIATIAEHKDILNAIIEKNSNDAYEKTLHHLLRNYEKLVRILPGLKIKEVDECIKCYSVITEQPDIRLYLPGE